MKAGAVDFLTKPFADQDVLDAIQAAIERDAERRRSAALMADLRGRYATLTEREQQIMGLVVIGHANKQIAAALDLSEMTVKVHRGQVIRKMQARSLPELVRFADRLTRANSNNLGRRYQNQNVSRTAYPKSVPAADDHARINGFARAGGTHLAVEYP
jgi:DNA-binding NarL/FixJ family response regulator